MWQTWRSRSQDEDAEGEEMALSGPLSPTLSYMHLSVLVSPFVYLHLWRLCGATAVAAVNGFICKAVSRTWLNLAKIETTNPQSDSTKGNKKKIQGRSRQKGIESVGQSEGRGGCRGPALLGYCGFWPTFSARVLRFNIVYPQQQRQQQQPTAIVDRFLFFGQFSLAFFLPSSPLLLSFLAFFECALILMAHNRKEKRQN